MQFKNIDSIKAGGFNGFTTMKELWNDNSSIPNEKGVYFIINPDCKSKKFLAKGVGGFFKQKDPNVALERLQNNWVEDCHVVYIGQAGGNGSSATLRKRLKQYLDFGKGKPVGHYGGRFIWQLANHFDLVIAWKIFNNEDPKLIERKLLNDFINEYNKMPFANLTL